MINPVDPWRIAARPLLAAAALTLALTGCSTQPQQKLASGEIAVSSADAARTAKLVSEWRAAHGLSPVRADASLNAPAAEQALAVARSGRLSHGDFNARMGRHGAPGAAAENLSAGSRDIADVINRWKRSPGHNRNMLLPGMRRIGVARATSPGQGYGVYWALVLTD